MSFIICKTCRADNAVNVTLHALDQGFEVWCFAIGNFENLVGL